MERHKIKYILKEYVEGRVVLTEQELNETLLNEGWKDILLGIALLTGVGLNQSQAQTAKDALSKDDVKNKIEQTLQDTSTLNKITKNLSPEVKSKIFKNADKALENLESKKGRVSSTVKAKGEKELSSRLKQGYALTGVESKSDTVISPGTTIIYTQALDFTIGADGLFKTGGYELSSEGINVIKSLKDSISQVGGKIESVIIESSTDKEPIKMGNDKLAELRAESVSKYFSDVDSIKTDIKPNQGPDLYSKQLSKSERESARKETSQFRYVKIIINATYQDTIVKNPEPEEKVIERNTYTLVKTVMKKSSGTSIRIDPPKFRFKFKIKNKRKCTNIDACPRFGQKKIQKFLDFKHQ